MLEAVSYLGVSQFEEASVAEPVSRRGRVVVVERLSQARVLGPWILVVGVPAVLRHEVEHATACVGAKGLDVAQDQGHVAASLEEEREKLTKERNSLPWE